MLGLSSRLRRSLHAFAREWRTPVRGYVSQQFHYSALPPGVTMTSGKGGIGRVTHYGAGVLTEYTTSSIWTKPRKDVEGD